MYDQSFYVTLPSNASKSIYPENTIANYTTRLAKPLQLQGLWEVALTEINYPFSWNTIDREDGVFHIEYREDAFNQMAEKIKLQAPSDDPQMGHKAFDDPTMADAAFDSEQLLYIKQSPDSRTVSIGGKTDPINNYRDHKDNVIRTSIRSGHYESIHAICRAINSKIENLRIPAEQLRLRYDEMERTVSVITSKLYKFIPGEKLSRILGLKDLIKPDGANYYADIKAGLYTLYVYTDIVQHQLVGDRHVQLLRTVAINGKNNDIITLNYTTPDYIPVCKNHFDSVTIAVCDDAGRHIKFKYGKVIVRLHFRRRKVTSV